MKGWLIDLAQIVCAGQNLCEGHFVVAAALGGHEVPCYHLPALHLKDIQDPQDQGLEPCQRLPAQSAGHAHQ